MSRNPCPVGLERGALAISGRRPSPSGSRRWCRAALRRAEKMGKRVRINSHEFLTFSNRATGGKDYKALVEGLERLRGTTISTNIRSGDEEQIDTFGLVESSSVRRKFGLDGRLLWVEVTLSDWVLNAIRNQEVLTLHPTLLPPPQADGATHLRACAQALRPPAPVAVRH